MDTDRFKSFFGTTREQRLKRKPTLLELQRAMDYSMGYMEGLRATGLKVGNPHYNDCSYNQMEIGRYAREVYNKDLKGTNFITLWDKHHV